MNATLVAQLEEWRKGAAKRAEAAYIAADHNPSAPENRMPADWGCGRVSYERRSNRTHGEIRGSVDIVASQVNWKWKNHSRAA